MKPYDLFIVVQPGLEKYAQMELNKLGITAIKQTKGALLCKGHLTTVIKINIYCRCVSRVLIDLGTFFADNFRSLEHGLKELPWQDFIAPAQLPEFCLHVASYQSSLYHEKAIADRILKSLGELYKQKISIVTTVGEQTQLIVTHVRNNRVTVRLDSSGIHLHKRGYNKFTETAPLRETIAAAMIYAAEWKSAEQGLCDPMCGAGTIPIEAALMASAVTWERFRNFTFMNWQAYSSTLMEKSQGVDFFPGKQSVLPIIGSDADAKSIETARQNAEKAGVSAAIEFRISPLKEMLSKDLSATCIITNPPWGERMSDGGDDTIYPDLIKIGKKAANLVLIHPSEKTEKLTDSEVLFQTSSGDIRLQCIKL